MKYSKNSVVFGDSSEIPSGVYTVRITKMERKVSQNGNPMIVTSGEIVAPNEVEVAGKTIQIAGKRIKPWNNMLNSAEAWGVGRLIDGLVRGGLDPKELQADFLEEDDIFCDGEGQPQALQVFVGKSVNMRVNCSPRIALRKPTADEVAAGQRDYVELKDPATGKPLTNGFQLETDWSNVVGPAEGSAGEGVPY